MLTLQKYSENRPCRVFAPLLVSLLLLLPVVATAQTDFDQKSIGIVDTVAMKSSPAKSGVEYTDIFLDTVNVKKAFVINDYSLFGVEYGVSLNGTSFNPSRNSKMVLDPTYFGVTWTKYGKLFGYMPYFGLQVGAFYGHEGYEFKMNKETGIIPTLDDNAVKVTPASGKVMLRARGSNITITDEGPGLQVGKTSWGHGLGLVITRELLDKLGATMQMQNRPGAGLEISIDL